jgi:hypothetical protein
MNQSKAKNKTKKTTIKKSKAKKTQSMLESERKGNQ